MSKKTGRSWRVLLGGKSVSSVLKFGGLLTVDLDSDIASEISGFETILKVTRVEVLRKIIKLGLTTVDVARDPATCLMHRAGNEMVMVDYSQAFKMLKKPGVISLIISKALKVTNDNGSVYRISCKLPQLIWLELQAVMRAQCLEDENEALWYVIAHGLVLMRIITNPEDAIYLRENDRAVELSI